MKNEKIRYITLALIGILLFVANVTLSSQSAILRGNVKYASSEITLDSIGIFLTDSIGILIKRVTTDRNGNYRFENLGEGLYDLETDTTVLQTQRITGIYLNGEEEMTIDLLLKDPCQQDISNGKCPICRSKRKVIPTSPGSIVSYNFGRDSILAMNAWEKIENKGYETWTNKNGEEQAINVLIESEKDKFWDNCNNWFCKRCKKVF